MGKANLGLAAILTTVLILTIVLGCSDDGTATPEATQEPTLEPSPTATATSAPTPTPTQAPEPTEAPTPTVACNPSYPDVCIPIGAADYDCAGGSGNGPNYISGPIRVLPPDPYDLDRDGDGIGCE